MNPTGLGSVVKKNKFGAASIAKKALNIAGDNSKNIKTLKIKIKFKGGSDGK